jgi:Arc/MetJ-type ribon-helix-helix transcriptional regulator
MTQTIEDEYEKFSNLEKISLNMPISELGRIDALIEAGITPNRTEFIRKAVRKELEQNMEYIEKIAPTSPTQDNIFSIGVNGLSKNKIDECIANKISLEIRMIGLLVVSKKISPAELDAVVKYCKVFGSIKATKPQKEVLKRKARKFTEI